MKNPNGYGSVFKLGGNRRKPWTARVTVGWRDDGGQIYEYLGYFEGRSEALIALADYNKSPYDIDARKINFEEVYDFLIKEKFPNGAVTNKEKSRLNGYRLGFRHSEPLHQMKFIEIRKMHMQDVINNSTKGYSTKSKINTLFNQMYKLAMSNDWVEKDYSQFVVVPENTEASDRAPFSQEEIKTLWDKLDKHDFVDTALIMIYTGMRPGELILIENENIHLEERYMIGGIKTKAGENRIIPIHRRIKPLIEKRMSNHKYLILNSRNGEMSYTTYRADRWSPLMKKLGMEHKPHDCRHTFATLMDDAGANKLSIKKIMGHSSSDITDRVYTHKNVEELVKAVDLLD